MDRSRLPGSVPEFPFMKRKTLICCIIGVLVLASAILGYKRMEIFLLVRRHFGSGNGGRLVYAALTGDKNRLEKYISQGVPVDFKDKDGFTALGAAILERDQRAVLLLLEHGANPNLQNNSGGSPIDLAILHSQNADDTWFLETLLKHGGNSKLSTSPMFYAIMAHSLPMVKLLVEAGADLNAKDRMNSTPLITASTVNAFDIDYYLLEKGADPRIKCGADTTMLYFIQHDPAYGTSGIDYREKVIDWLKTNNFWKEENIQVQKYAANIGAVL